MPIINNDSSKCALILKERESLLSILQNLHSSLQGNGGRDVLAFHAGHFQTLHAVHGVHVDAGQAWPHPVERHAVVNQHLAVIRPVLRQHHLQHEPAAHLEPDRGLHVVRDRQILVQLQTLAALLGQQLQAVHKKPTERLRFWRPYLQKRPRSQLRNDVEPPLDRVRVVLHAAVTERVARPGHFRRHNHRHGYAEYGALIHAGHVIPVNRRVVHTISEPGRVDFHGKHARQVGQVQMRRATHELRFTSENHFHVEAYFQRGLGLVVVQEERLDAYGVLLHRQAALGAQINAFARASAACDVETHVSFGG